MAALACSPGHRGSAEPRSDPREQIINALAPKPVTRSLTLSPPERGNLSGGGQVLDSLRNRPTRSLTLDERQELATIAKDKLSIDIEIDFDYNSAQIGATATPGVTALGKALSSPQLANGTFMLAGHTDGKGSDAVQSGSLRAACRRGQTLSDRALQAAGRTI